MPSRKQQIRERSSDSPRRYLSWSQLDCFEKDPNEYYLRYIEGVPQMGTAYLELGRKLSEALERGKDPDPMLNHLVLFIPRNGKREVEINVNFEGIPLKGVLDSFDEKTLTFREYKSGKNWTQSMVDNHGQLTFYQLLIQLKYGRYANPIWLDWAETQEKDGELSFTGKLRSFKTERTMKDLILMGGRIHRAWEGIASMMKTTHN